MVAKASEIFFVSDVLNLDTVQMKPSKDLFIFLLIMIANQLTPLIQRPPHLGWRIFHTAKVLNMSTS